MKYYTLKYNIQIPDPPLPPRNIPPLPPPPPPVFIKPFPGELVLATPPFPPPPTPNP